MAKKSVEALIAETLEIPTFPPAARKVIELTDRESTSTADLEQILSKDQGIALRVLGFVNSAYFNTGRRVDTILDAIMLIGFHMLRALVVGASVRNMFRKFGATEKNLWEHSVLASLASSSVARVKKEVPIELALVAGLIHDVGKVVLNNSMPHEYDEITALGRRHGGLLLQSESRAFGFNHGDVGALLLRAWDLMCGWDFHLRDIPPSSDEVAAAWRPYVETCIEAFGPNRCMMESNFPVDKQSCGYGVLWNAFKRITKNCTAAEKAAMYHDTAARVYRPGVCRQ